MKILMPILSALLILMSCSQEQTDEQFALDQQKEMIKADPLFTKYIKATEAQARLSTESKTLDLQKYSDIIKNKNTALNVCDIDKKIFEGNTEMEQLANLHCATSKAAQALKDKYPFISKMTTRERLAFFKDFGIRYNYDIEARRDKARKAYEKQQKEINALMH